MIKYLARRLISVVAVVVIASASLTQAAPAQAAGNSCTGSVSGDFINLAHGKLGSSKFHKRQGYNLRVHAQGSVDTNLEWAAVWNPKIRSVHICLRNNRAIGRTYMGAGAGFFHNNGQLQIRLPFFDAETSAGTGWHRVSGGASLERGQTTRTAIVERWPGHYATIQFDLHSYGSGGGTNPKWWPYNS